MEATSSPIAEDEGKPDSDSDPEGGHCTICLQPFLDRAILPTCAHEFCFDCVLLWSDQSRKCPLCATSFDGSYFIHRVRSQYDYQKHYLPPLPSSSTPPTDPSRANALRHTRRARQWGRRQRRERQEADQLERAIARRRWIYRHHLYAKHVASNPHTRYRPFPTPAQFAASPDLVSRMTTFLRRELRVWPDLDVEFLTTYTIALMKSIDVRSESAVKLLSEFLDLDAPYSVGARHVNAEHFAHEIYSYLRSPYRDLDTYDQIAQYDTPPDVPPPPPDPDGERGSRWNAGSSRRSRSRSDSRPSPHREREASDRESSVNWEEGRGPDRGEGGLTRSGPRGRDRDHDRRDDGSRDPVARRWRRDESRDRDRNPLTLARASGSDGSEDAPASEGCRQAVGSALPGEPEGHVPLGRSEGSRCANAVPSSSSSSSSRQSCAADDGHDDNVGVGAGAPGGRDRSSCRRRRRRTLSEAVLAHLGPGLAARTS